MSEFKEEDFDMPSRLRIVRLRIVATVCSMAFLVACSHTYGLSRQLQGQELLPANAVVYVALPEPGSIGSQVYPQSGSQTGEAIVRVVAPYVSLAELAVIPETADEARETAIKRGASHLVYSEIAHWEDRSTEWSGKPDRIRILVKVYGVESGELIDAAEITGKSRWGTFGGDHPQDMLDQSLSDYLESIAAGASDR